MSNAERVDRPQADGHDPGLLTRVTNAMVALHKQQFGRGPERSRAGFADDDTLVCTLHDALLPAERAMVAMGHQERVQESRLFFQTATRDKFVDVVESITGRKVVAFSSATDPEAAVVWEVFVLEPATARET